MLVVWRTAALIAEVWLACHVRSEGLHQARFANAGFATEQDHLTQTLLDLRPTLLQQPDFAIPPHQGREALGASYVQPTLRPAHLDDAIDLERRGHPSEGLDAEVMYREIPLHQTRRSPADDHGVRCSKTLQAGGKVGRLA